MCTQPSPDLWSCVGVSQSRRTFLRWWIPWRGCKQFMFFIVIFSFRCYTLRQPIKDGFWHPHPQWDSPFSTSLWSSQWTWWTVARWTSPGGLWHEPDKVARQAETPVARFPSEQTHPSLSQLLPAMRFLVHKHCIFNMHKMEPTLAGHFAKRSNLFAPSIALHF